MNFLSWQTNKIKFINTSLDIVAKTLSKHYQKEIVLLDEELKKVKLTTTLDNQPLGNALEIITLTINIEIETKNDTIFLKNN